MGIKQHFASAVASAAGQSDLKTLWETTSGEPVVVFDGTNFLLSFSGHPQFSAASITVPRLKEYASILKAVLQTLLSACPRAALHFVLDGSSKEQLACKDAEHSARAVKGLCKHLVDGEIFCTQGYAHRADSFSTLPLVHILCRVLRTLGGDSSHGGHKVFRAHSDGRADLDVAVALHAREVGARLLFSGDSDFAVLCASTVVPLRSLRIEESGRFVCEPQSLQHRLQAFGLERHEELLVVAFLAGSDFHPPIVEVKDPGDWKQQVVPLARELLASSPSWQQAVRAAAGSIACSETVDSFLRNFDLSAYVPSSLGDATPSWSDAGGSVCFGLTGFFPGVQDLDPILSTFGNWVSDAPAGDEAGVPLHPTRLLKAYASGHLSGMTLRLVRFRGTQMQSSYSQAIEGVPVQVHSHKFLSRVACFLAGPERDSWDDDNEFCFADSDFFDSILIEEYQQAVVRPVSSVVEHLAMKDIKVGELRFPSCESDSALKKRLEEEIQSTKDALASHLGSLEFVKLVKLERIPESKLTGVWTGATVAHPTEEALLSEARANSVFFLATGMQLSKLSRAGQDLVIHCIEPTQSQVDETKRLRLFLLSLCAAYDGYLVPEHVEQLRKSLRLDRHASDLEVRSPNFALPGPCFDRKRVAGSALLLGDFCWAMYMQLQDSYCLCGGEGLLFPNGFNLNGGPIVVMDDGLVHKAKDGYKVSVLGVAGMVSEGQADQVEAVLSFVERCVRSGLSHCGDVQRKGSWLKLTGVSPAEAFFLHRRVVIRDCVPYTLNVKPFDWKRPH